MRKPHIISRNESERYPKVMIFFDVESVKEERGDDIDKAVFRLGVSCYVKYDSDKGVKKEEWFYFNRVMDFWKWVDERVKKKSLLRMFALNVDFDFRVLEGFKQLKELGYEVNHLIYDNNRVIVRFKKGDKRLVILDIGNYFKMSVRRIGKSIGLSKLLMPSFDESDEKWFEYCKRDVEIIKEVMLQLMSYLKKNELSSFKDTLASIAFSSYKHKFMKIPIYIHTNEEAIELEKSAYHGGRCECFFIGEIKGEKVYKLDVNSLYPYVMFKYDYPIRLLFVKDNVSLNDLKRCLDRYLVIGDVLIEINKPIICVKRERLIFPVGSFRCVLTSPELRLVEKYGKIIECYKLSAYDYGKIFYDYVQYFYAQRVKFKEESNKAFELFAKGLLNSLYGKFGQQVVEWKKVGETDEEDGYYEIYDSVENRKVKYRVINGIVFKEETEKRLANDSFIAIPCFVTAYGRCEVFKFLEIIGEGNCYYIDTDSFFVNKEGFKRVNSFIDKRKLGYLKIEMTANYLKINGLKDYQFGKEVKVKGIKSNAKKISDGVYIQDQFEKFRSAIRNNRVNEVVISSMEKRLRREYNKGIVKEDGWVVPFVLR